MPKRPYRDRVHEHVIRLLAAERERQPMSMTQLAEKSGLSQGMISLVERGLRNPSLDVLLRIADALEVKLSSVFEKAERLAAKEG